MGVVAPGEKKI